VTNALWAKSEITFNDKFIGYCINHGDFVA